MATHPAADRPLLEVRSIVKRFPGVLALDQVSLTLGRGEVLAVIGENGAGKSTLMKILAGVQTADAGALLLDGEPVTIDSVATALRLGIALIHSRALRLRFFITLRSASQISFVAASSVGK